MSGRPYTVSELKTIVDYLVENKLYSETRARKMWVDFANTKITNRTWQSLKETFLKRILPDIHNPYYKLTNEQISSFRARCDLADKDKNKLEIHTISDDSSSNGHNPKDNEPSNDEGETNAGENTKCSKIPMRNRSSADTVILEHCYETVEDIKRDLESTEEKIQDLKQSVANKSLRDCITYSEPLTPMLQEVLDDFASEPEDSDRENRMEIVESESVPEADNVEDIEIIHEQVPDFDNDNAASKSAEADADGTGNDNGAETVEELLEQEIDSESCPDNRPPNTNSNTVDESEGVVLDEEISSMQAETNTDKNIDINSELIDSVSVEKEIQPDSFAGDTSSNNLHTEPLVQSTAINNSNSTVEASLPNNPEAFKNKQSKNVEVNNQKTQEITKEVSNVSDKTKNAAKATRKRSVSEDQSAYTHKKKKRLHIQLKSSSESDGKPTTESQRNVTQEDKVPKVNGDVTKAPAAKMGKPKGTDECKPSTSSASRIENVIEIEDATTELPPAVINPCLQNVSLFDEQFNKTRHNMSESSDSEKNKKQTEAEKPNSHLNVAKVSKEARKSCTESDTETTPSPPKKKKRVGVISSKTERDKAIAHMFGVTSGGGVHSKRKRRVSRRARTISHNTSQQNAGHSNTSDWTSESESDEYVSPPRGRRNRPTRKYLKPRSAKISSLEEEGGLFVMYGKRIYPVVKDGKIIKNYVTFLPESESDEELFWKQKYVEEKKKAAELKKLLDEATEPKQNPVDNNTAVQQPNPIRTPRPSLVQVAEPSNGLAKDVPSPQLEEKKEMQQMGPPEKIKIKFTKNNEEVHLEGHWPQIHPVLEQVVQIFHKESESAVSEPPPKPAATNGVKEPNSGLSTPIVVTVDPEVHEKVNKIEKEIFQEIEKRDQEEDVKPNGVSNVTKRKQPAQRKSSSSSLPTPEKQQKISNVTNKQSKESIENGRPRRQKAKETENKSVDNKEISPKRQNRSPRKVLNETVNTNLKTMQTRRSKQNLDTSNPKDQEEEEEVKYMLATRSKRLSLKTANNKTNKKTYKSAENLPRIFSSPDNLAPYSMDSTQGYQDSDISPAKPETRRKKKLDMSSFVIKTRNSLRRSSKNKSYPYLHCDAYNDSSNSSLDAPIKIAQENSTLKSDAYRSDSYQLLMPQVKIVLSRHLEPIHETSPNANETYFTKEMPSENVSAPKTDNHTSNSGQITSDIGSSSNMSLPMSPELSIVENLSISKDILNSAEDYPTINEMPNEDANGPMACDNYNYRISEVDVTLPLMNQECDFESYHTASDPHSGGQGLVTESLLNKIDTFNINEQVTATDTLNKKLHDLLLESAKKVSRKASTENKDSVMEVDVTTGPSDAKKKAKAKKRCSTPQKRKGSKKSAAPQVDPVVEEEHVESFSHGGGRKSCPPLFQAYLGGEVITEEVDIANLTIATEKPKGRKKKDIIRVKIQRPKHKLGYEKVRSKSAKNGSKLSVFTDSGINETESEVFQPANESVELIHNHSETCLLANDCVGDSLEFVENSKSVITLNDSLQSGDAWNNQTQIADEHCPSPSPDFFCNNAQDVCSYKNAKTDIDSVSETVYHSPYGTPNSLITEDISDDSPLASRPAKWYLLSEDETNNTNLVGQGSAMLNAGSYASNLKHIFPVTCAVPDLSTITEMSDSSRKPALDDLAGLTGDDFNSLSVFDSNFNV